MRRGGLYIVMEKNIVWHSALASQADRQAALGQRGAVLWFTGLSGSGKSTIATRVEKALVDQGRAAYLLDGDNVRHGLNADLSFSPADREENIRRIAETAALFADAGMIVLVSAISPLRALRERARACVEKRAPFCEIYVKASVEACAARDPKGLYAKALRGEIAEFTGVSAPYEPPERPDLLLDTETMAVDACVRAALSEAERLSIPYDAMLRTAVNASLEAGRAIMAVYARDFSVTYKADSSPLTEADTAADGIIAAALARDFPRCALLSEERADDRARLGNPLCFIVDPLDGTKEFVKKNGEFTVNIALAYRGRSVMGVVYAPALDELYFAADGLGAFYCPEASTREDPIAAAARIHVSDRRDNLVMMLSRSHMDDETRALIAANQDKIADTRPAGSSLKGCLIARGIADLYYRSGPTMEWDTAAVQCVAEQAGAVFRQGDGAAMTYNREDSLNSKGFYIINAARNQLRRP